jgi:hypothetical protein
MNIKKTVATNLAAAFLAGNWSLRSLVRRGAKACGEKGRWLSALVRRVMAACGEGRPHVSHEQLTAFILRDAGFELAYERFGLYPLRHIFWPLATMNPITGPPATWLIPSLASTTQLADWLGCAPTRLDWLAGRYTLRGTIREASHPRYTWQWIRKRSGHRLLEKPIFALKQIQRRILREILAHIPLHDAVHSYRAGHSIADFVSPHVGKRVVFRTDLRDFFPSIGAGRVQALFTTLGYPREVARALTGLCNNAVSAGVFDTQPCTELPQAARWRLRQLYGRPHLPQGAPSSPMLSNLCAYRLDLRLAALAASAGAAYTRYADDLAFSGDCEFEKSYRRFHVAVCRVALEEGFEINTRKTRLMRRAVCQRLAGLVVNACPNIARRDFDRLKAILHNCVRHGPGSQTSTDLAAFRASLAGKVQYVRMIHPGRGDKLSRLFERIDWTGSR